MSVVPPRPTPITFEDYIRRIRINSGPNIFYVSPYGNDEHDGLSWATAKETVLAAYDAIRNPDPNPDKEIYGVIYIAHRSKIHQDEKQGIWIMGRGDPYWVPTKDGGLGHNYNTENPPAGWRKAKHVLFKGVGGECLPYSLPAAAQLGQLGQEIHGEPFAYYVYDVHERDYPAIWLSGVSQIVFENLIIKNRRVGINLGKVRRGVNHVNNDDPSYCLFRNVCIDVVGSSTGYLDPHAAQDNPPRPEGDRPEIIRRIVSAHPELRPYVDDPSIINPHIERYVHERVGPCVYIEKGLKIRFENCVFVTSYYEQLANNEHSMFLDEKMRYSVYSDNRAGILAKTPGLVSISNCFFKCGNFKYYGLGHAFGFEIRDCIFEGNWITNPLKPSGPDIPSPSGPLVHITGAADGHALIENIGAGDLSTEANVKVEGGEQAAGAVVCINVGTVKGPATILNIPSTANWQHVPWTLAGQRQVGFWQGRVSAQHDSARRAFSPVAARFKNLVNQDSSTWEKSGPSIKTGIIAPDGTLGAFRLSPIEPWTPTAPERKRVLLLDVNNNQSTNNQSTNTSNVYVNQGDIVVAGVWVRGAGEHGLPPWVIHLLEVEFHPQQHYKFDNGLELLFANAPLKGDGEWEWISVVGRVGKVTTREVEVERGASKAVPVRTELSMYLNCVNYIKEDEVTHKTIFKHSHPHDFYAPILLHIPGTHEINNEIYRISDNEIQELRQHMSTWPDNVEPGTVSLQRGQDFALQSHIISRGKKPKLWGVNWSKEVDGNDVSGRIFVKGGSIIEEKGRIATLGFIKSFRSNPRVLLTAANDYASTVPIFVESSGKEFSIKTTMTGQLEKDSEWNYFVIE